MLDDLLASRAEASSGAERARQAADDHVDFLSIHILCFRDAATGSPEDAVGPCFVKDDTELVAELELDL